MSKATTKPCPKCGAPMLRRTDVAVHGGFAEQVTIWACVNLRCNHTQPVESPSTE